MMKSSEMFSLLRCVQTERELNFSRGAIAHKNNGMIQIYADSPEKGRREAGQKQGCNKLP